MEEQRKRKLPKKKKKENNENNTISNNREMEINTNTNQIQNQQNAISRNNQINNNDINNMDQQRQKEKETIVRKIQNEEHIKLQRRLRQRHNADGAININLQLEDLKNDKYSLYDNKDINLDAPKVKEKIDPENTEYYIESIHHDKYFKIDRTIKDIKKDETIKEKKDLTGNIKKKEKKNKYKKHLTFQEIAQAKENKLKNEVDRELSNVISKTLSKVTLIFLFAQGLLAGMGLLHIIIILTYKDFKSFLQHYAQMIIILFNIFHALTFSSLVGNGIKFVSALQKYRLISNQLDNNMSMFTRLRQNMIFSAIMLFFFTIVFCLEIYLTTQVQEINLSKCLESKNSLLIISSDDFQPFKFCHLIIDFIVIILFVLNIFDINVQEPTTEIINPTYNYSFFIGGSDEAQGELDELLGN